MKKQYSFVKSDGINWVKKIKQFLSERDWRITSAKIAVNILDNLEERGMSKKELSELSNIPIERINKIVKGQEKLDPDTLRIISNVLNISL